MEEKRARTGERRTWVALAFALMLGSGCGSSTDLSTMIPELGISSPTARTSSASSLIHGSSPQFAADGFTELKPLSESKADIQNILKATTTTDCFKDVKFQAFSKNVSCYGPQLKYSSHPTGGGSGQLPSGDLGIWTATEGADGEACASAKMNALVGDVAATSTVG